MSSIDSISYNLNDTSLHCHSTPSINSSSRASPCSACYVITNTATQVVLLSTNASRITLMPQAPGSGTLSCFSRSASTYALLPTRASISRVASAASAAFFTAARKSDGFAENASTNAASGSMSVRDGGRARVYVYSRSRAAETARDQSCTATTLADEAMSAWARAEKKILVVLDQYDSRESEYKANTRVQCAAGTTHLLCRHFRDSDESSDDILATDRACAETCEHS